MRWKEILDAMPANLVYDFADKSMSYNDFYKCAVDFGVGPQVRKLKERGADSARRGARSALAAAK